jgi:enamine deaminase RidA (YjgF/YER057c/UK114 family)
MSKKSMQPPFLIKNVSNLTTLDSYLELSGQFGTESPQYATPLDLLGNTNANEVLDVDYYQQTNRVAAVLATDIQNGVYGHFKAICDRLNNSTLMTWVRILQEVTSVNFYHHTG